MQPPEKAHHRPIRPRKCPFYSRKRSPLGLSRPFCGAKVHLFPGNPHIKRPRSPVKSHLSTNLRKRKAESVEIERPEKPHLCLHRHRSCRSGTVRLSLLCSPENPHLSKILWFARLLNPLTTFPATAHADPRTPSLRLPKIVTMVPVKFHLVGRKPLLHKAVPWR